MAERQLPIRTIKSIEYLPVDHPVASKLLKIATSCLSSLEHVGVRVEIVYIQDKNVLFRVVDVPFGPPMFVSAHRGSDVVMCERTMNEPRMWALFASEIIEGARREIFEFNQASDEAMSKRREEDGVEFFATDCALYFGVYKTVYSVEGGGNALEGLSMRHKFKVRDFVVAHHKKRGGENPDQGPPVASTRKPCSECDEI